jgi:hypothetical protein
LTLAVPGLEAGDCAVADPGARPILVVPNLVRLRFDGAGAEYVPYPGLALAPRQRALQLAPVAQTRFLPTHASGRRGVSRLPPGDCWIVAVQEVPPDLRPPEPSLEAAGLWRG